MIQAVLCSDSPAALVLVCEQQAAAKVVCWLQAGQAREALPAAAPAEPRYQWAGLEALRFWGPDAQREANKETTSP